MKPSPVRFVDESGSDSDRREPWFIRIRAHLVACAVALEALFAGRNPLDIALNGRLGGVWSMITRKPDREIRGPAFMNRFESSSPGGWNHSGEPEDMS